VPELPEVETTVRGLAQHLEGERLKRVAVNRADLRRAKYGLIHTDRELTLVFHLGMSGRWRIDPDSIGKHDHLVLETAAHVFALCDPRRFGSVDLLATATLDTWPQFAALGPEPLGPDFTAEQLQRALAGRSATVKAMLLDQRIVAGLGNIYVCEALYRAGIDPRKAAGKVSRRALQRLVPEVQAVLEEAIDAGGSSLRDYAQPSGQLGYFAKSFDVYDREGEACRCGGKVRRIVQGGRSTWFCGKCQR
jgi:formamidopyrimidine-DNA glycosylase